MQQDIDLLVQVVMKCLTDSIIPALEDKDKFSCEQARLCFKTLQSVKALVPLRHHFTRTCLKNSIDVATELARKMDSLDSASSALLRKEISKSQRLYDISTISADDIAKADRSLNELTCDFAQRRRADKDTVKALLFASKEKIDTQRAWCFDNGIESENILAEFVSLTVGEHAHE